MKKTIYNLGNFMNDYQFRAYCEETKRMITVEGISWENGKLDILEGYDEKGVFTWWREDLTPIHLMRKLVIPCRDGLSFRELYEGDIVEVPERYDGVIWKEKTVGFVKQEEDDAFEFFISSLDGDYICSIFDFIYNLGGSVLGNIYQNKNLLYSQGN